VSAYQGASEAAIVVVNNIDSAVRGQVFSVGSVAKAAKVTPWITDATRSLAPQASIPVSSGPFTYTIPASSVVTFYFKQ
jgi:glucuronoarabinoxylan endo-1,4-beta-xylanase